MDVDALSEVMGGSLPRERYAAMLPAYEQAMVAAGCTTVVRACQWHAQIGHESSGLRYMGELWGRQPTAQQAKYDPASGSKVAVNLGNDRPGDGYRYRGAGPLQITGKANFRSVSVYAFERGLVPTRTYFVDNPDELRSDRYGFIGALWYWTVSRPTLNVRADAEDVTACTKLINGGTTGLADRQARYRRARAMGARVLPSAAPAAPAAPARVAAPPALFAAAVEDPVILDPTEMPADRNSDPRTWRQVVRFIPFDIAGGWLGDCAVALTAEELGGRTVDKFGAYLQLASWAFDPPKGGTDVVLRPVNTLLSTAGPGAPLQRHWPTPAYVAPAGARGLVINFAAPAGLNVAIGRHPTG
jgi:predicted chitinase